MSSRALPALTNLAIEMLGAPPAIDQHLASRFNPGFGDPVLDGAVAPHGLLFDAYGGPALSAALQAVESDPAMESLVSRGGELDPMLSSDMGGARQDLRALVLSTVTTALRQIYFESSALTAAELVQRTIENYEALKRVARGEPVLVRVVHGLTGVHLPEGSEIATPWGVVKPAPASASAGSFYGSLGSFRPVTTAILIRSQSCIVHVSKAASPDFPPPDPASGYFAIEQRIRELLPLAFALAIEDERRCAPTMTFTTALQPFSAGLGVSSSLRLGPPWQQTNLDEADVPAIEEWARRLNTRHVDNLQVASRRIVSAISERLDRTDALVDAVMAWESLVGTRSETVFRVTAALSKLIETDPMERRALRKALGSTYELRSRLVHGEQVDTGSIGAAADKAIDIALAAMRALYGRRSDWLSYTSTERADRLLLEE